jgi:carbon monoxide dehydrogenase subunit G
MAFQVVKTFVVNAPARDVWAFLIDPRRVAACMPGAAITSQVDDKTFTGTMTVKVGPVTTSYRGKVVFQRLDADKMAAEIVASGQDVKGKGGANMKLSSSLVEVAPGQTEVTATSDLTITGLLAQMGRGMIQDVSDELFQVFSTRVRAELERPGAAAAEPGSSPAGDGASSAEAAGAPPGRAGDGQALDLGAIGARAAGRAARRALAGPAFWIAVLLIAALLYLLFVR